MTTRRFAVIGVWLAGVALVSTYAGATWRADGPAAPEPAPYLEGLDFEETRPLSVPILADGAVTGYVVAQFVFTADARTLKQLTVTPHAFVVDEALRAIYANDKANFAKLQRVDLDAMLATIRTRVNARFGGDLVKDVLIKDFNYVRADQLRG